jgi:hypothetical protein
MGLDKKAQIDIQFNWIFILIVGAIILSFFVGISVWYKGVQEQKINSDIVVKLDSLFMTAKESPKTARYTEIPAVTLEFTCSPDECSGYGCPSAFSGSGVSMATETEVLFALGSLDATNIITWSLEWALPYKIANFLYLTHDGVRYVLVYDDDHSETAYAVNSLLAENSYITKESINIDNEGFSLMDKNDDYVRIVAFLDQGILSETVVASYLGDREEDDVAWDIVYVDGTEDAGTLTYEDGDADYVGLPLLIGGIFAEDVDYYSCNLYKAGIQAELISAVYYARAERLETYFGGPDDPASRDYCSYYFGTDAQAAIKAIEQGFIDGTVSASLYDEVALLENNNAYAVIKGCPRLY